MISPFIVPDKAAAIPNLPLLRMCIATLNPSPTSTIKKKKKYFKKDIQKDYWDARKLKNFSITLICSFEETIWFGHA